MRLTVGLVFNSGYPKREVTVDNIRLANRCLGIMSI